MPRKRTIKEIYVDANGALTECVQIGGQEVVIHYDDLPESDITTVNGIRCTTALRTVIDLAPTSDARELDRMVRHCLERRLFSTEEAMARIAEPDMASRPGAHLLRRALSLMSGGDTATTETRSGDDNAPDCDR